MAEYWKSQPKKFCDFCKCWITDNKASVDFHERGKKHQENVKLRIEEVKKKGVERRNQKDQLNDDLAAIEAAALEAYKKDLNLSDDLKTNQPKLDSKQEIKAKECLSGKPSASSNISTWTAYQTPEGYWYYYNNQTGETRWDAPHGFQQYDESSKEQTDEGDAIGDSIKAPPKNDTNTVENASNPLGVWETVAVYDRNDSVPPKPEEAVRVKDEELPAVKFKEKQLTTSKRPDVSENVAFKKRKSTQERKRNIRQRTDDS